MSEEEVEINRNQENSTMDGQKNSTFSTIEMCQNKCIQFMKKEAFPFNQQKLKIAAAQIIPISPLLSSTYISANNELHWRLLRTWLVSSLCTSAKGIFPYHPSSTSGSCQHQILEAVFMAGGKMVLKRLSFPVSTGH